MGGLAFRSLCRAGSDVMPPTLAAVLPLHARGPRALSLICFAKVEPGELVEGPRGGSSRAPPAQKPADFDITIEEDSELLGRTKLPPLKVNVNLPPELLAQLGPLKDVVLRLVEIYVTAYMDAIREGPVTQLVNSHTALNDAITGEIEAMLKRVGVLENDYVLNGGGQPIMADYLRDDKTGRYILNEDGSPKLFKSGRPLTKFRKMQVELEITLLSFVESLFNQAIGAVEQRLAAYHQAMVQSHANLQAMERRLAELIPRVERLAEENAALTRQNIELAHAANSVLQENNRLRTENAELKLAIKREVDRLGKEVIELTVKLERFQEIFERFQRG